MRDYQEIIQENKRRNSILDAPYDPVKGIGGPLERFEIEFKDIEISFFVPVDMREAPVTSLILLYDTLSEAAEALFTTPEKLFEAFILERYKYDFEFWAFTCIKITEKDTFKDIPFKLRGAQREILKELETMRMAGVPIRIVLLKARQFGGSTLIQIYMMWIQQIHKTGWHLAVCAQGDDPAKNISDMYERAAKTYPEEIGKITFKSYKGSTKNKYLVERECVVGVGSVNNPDQFRSYNYAMAHLSEVGLWQDTEKRKAINLISSLKETVPNQPYTLIAEESTAKGLNYFHKSWKKAISMKTRYRAVFVPWWRIDRDRVSLTCQVEEFLSQFEDYHWYLWDLGATLEGINWYMLHKADNDYQDWEMMAENPSTPEEAFQSSGQKVFPPNYVEALRQYCTKPKLIGDIFGETRAGENSLKNLRIEKVNNGKLQVWKFPEEIKGQRVKHRIAAFVDIGGTTKKADNSVIKLLDREPMIYGNDPEVICQWTGHIDQDLLAWKAAQLCMIYAEPEIAEFPLLAFEIQSLNKKELEGSHSLTILDTIKDYYPNLFIRNDEEKLGDEFVPRYGFHTNVKTKGLIIDTAKSAMREVFLSKSDEQSQWGYIERDDETCNEYSYYEVKDNGSMGAIDGKRDDRVMTTAGILWLALRYMSMPFIVKEAPKTTRKGQTRGYADF